ncbi:putative disease resistance protein Aig2 [Stachybotrys elegans]|uniref:Putative gamma-glutamylcyclotransferase n=1 Tax=Stachybotrys elegans TaxID=80388 RepID=A0A8K0WRV6_9HYPO|nr:putative disease resistance protein Aig2 [Stachybotrys elegans]
MAPEVFFSVCYLDSSPPEAVRNLYTFSPAILDGYCRHRVKYADYPAIIPEEGHTVRGIYATGLTDANLSKLDFFEGSEYERKTVSIRLEEKDTNGNIVLGETKTTSVYVFIRPEGVERGEWDFEKFCKEKMQSWTRGDWAFDQDPDDRAKVESAAV